MNKPHLLVHIGLPKTGTTYLQTCLKNSRKRLAKLGVLYPTTGLFGPGHARLSPYYLNRSLLGQLNKSNILSSQSHPIHSRDNILYELGKISASRAIISAESFSNSSERGIEEFRAHYENYFDISVLVFLRRQDHLAESLRAQSFRVNQQGAIVEADVSEKHSLLNYSILLNKWSEVFGKQNIIIREYPESNKNQLGSVFADALEISDSVFSIDERINSRLNRHVLEYIYRHSDLRYGTKKYFNSLKKLQKIGNEFESDPRYRYFFSPDQRKAMVDRFKPSNLEVEKQYNLNLFSDVKPIDLNEPWLEYTDIPAELLKRFKSAI